MDIFDGKDIILIFPTSVKTNTTVWVLKTPKTESSIRRVYIPKSVALFLVELKKEQEEIKLALGNVYHDYNLVMTATFELPIGDSCIRTEMQKVTKKLGLPNVVFHSILHPSVTYKLKLSGGDVKAVQGDSGHAQADMVTEIYGHIIDGEMRNLWRKPSIAKKASIPICENRGQIRLWKCRKEWIRSCWVGF